MPSQTAGQRSKVREREGRNERNEYVIESDRQGNEGERKGSI